MYENTKFFPIETLLLSEVEAARSSFAQVKWKSMDDAERTDKRANFLRALDRLSDFILRGVIPSDLQQELSDVCIIPPRRLPIKNERQQGRSNAA
jgi:hypothetical protein